MASFRRQPILRHSSQDVFLQAGLKNDCFWTDDTQDKLCSICQLALELEEEHILKIQACGHYFHATCYVPFLTIQHRKRGTCPECHMHLFIDADVSSKMQNLTQSFTRRLEDQKIEIHQAMAKFNKATDVSHPRVRVFEFRERRKELAKWQKVMNFRYQALRYHFVDFSYYVNISAIAHAAKESQEALQVDEEHLIQKLEDQIQKEAKDLAEGLRLKHNRAFVSDFQSITDRVAVCYIRNRNLTAASPTINNFSMALDLIRIWPDLDMIDILGELLEDVRKLAMPVNMWIAQQGIERPSREGASYGQDWHDFSDVDSNETY